MRRWLLPIAVLLLAQGVSAEEQLNLPAPTNWQTLTAIDTPMMRMSAFAVPGKGPGDIDKLSFEWFHHDMAEDVDTFSLVEQVAGTIRQNCAGGSDQPVFAGMENGYPTVVRLLACPRLNDTDPPRGEMLLMKAIEGASGFWLVVRGRDLTADDGTDVEALRGIVADWSAGFRSIALCDPDLDAHPCPELD